MSNFEVPRMLVKADVPRPQRPCLWPLATPPSETALLAPFGLVALLIYDEKCMKQWMGYDVTERKQEY